MMSSKKGIVRGPRPCKRCGGTEFKLEHRGDFGRDCNQSGLTFWCTTCSSERHLYGYSIGATGRLTSSKPNLQNIPIPSGVKL